MVAEHDDEYLRGFLHRTTMLLGEGGVARLRDRTVAIAGCGGVGGATAITLARLGVGGFVLADPGRFDPPDLNRQWAGRRSTLGRNKAEVHAELLREINPRVRLTTYPEGIGERNLDAVLAGADLLVDCLDISVPLPLRTRVYRRAMEQGIYAVSAPIFGFGTLVLLAEPGGMGMDELVAGFVRVASAESKLPRGFPDWYFRPHVRAIEREIAKHRVPTSGIAVTVASGLVAAEIARIFLREEYPELDGPTVLPNVLAVDPLRRTFRVMHHRELFREPPGDRAAALEAAGRSVALLGKDAVEVDFLSDSGADRPAEPAPPADADPDELVGRLYGVSRAWVVSRGRFAEAVLAPLVVERGEVVACNALFPTTRFHVEAAGGRLVDVSAPTGHLDLDRLAELLATGEVGAIWLEPCSNASGGAPLSIESARAARRLADDAGVRLVLDTTRIWTNAVLLGGGADVVHEMCALADACAGSLTKDLPAPIGGMLATRDEALAVAIRDRVALMTGSGLSRDDRAALAGHLTREPPVAERVAAVRALADRLVAAGVPAFPGGHAAFVDAAAALPHLAPEDHADQVLANALYVEAGVRVAPNLRTPDQPGQRWLRCAVPVGRRDPSAADRLVRAAEAVLARRGELCGLVAEPAGPGALASFSTRYRPRP